MGSSSGSGSGSRGRHHHLYWGCQWYPKVRHCQAENDLIRFEREMGVMWGETGNVAKD